MDLMLKVGYIVGLWCGRLQYNYNSLARPLSPPFLSSLSLLPFSPPFVFLSPRSGFFSISLQDGPWLHSQRRYLRATSSLRANRLGCSISKGSPIWFQRKNLLKMRVFIKEVCTWELELQTKKHRHPITSLVKVIDLKGLNAKEIPRI